METFQKFFLTLTLPTAEATEEAYQEQMVKVVSVMMALTLLLFSIPISIGWGIIQFDRVTIMALLILDVLAGVTGFLALSGNWKVARIIPIGLFFGFGLYGNYWFGPATTFLLFYALAIILTSIFYSKKILLITLLASLVSPPAMEMLRGYSYLPLHMDIPVFVMVAGLLTGIGLTQWYAVDMLRKTVRQSIDNAEALAEERDLTNNIMKILPIGICMIDPEGDFTYANQFIAETLGIEAPQILKQSLQSVALRVTDVDDQPLSPEHFSLEGIQKSRAIVQGERFTVRPNDTQKEVIVSVNAAPMFDSDGDFNGVVVAVQDITDGVRAVQALRRSEERFRQIAENVQEVFWVGTLDWSELVYVSPAYQYIWGKSVQSLYDDPDSWLDSVYEADLEVVKAFVKKIADGDFSNPQIPEFRIVLSDDELRWISVRVFPVINEQGEVYRITGIAEDITERKLVEEELRENQERYQLASKAGQVGVWDWDMETNRIYVDPNMKAMLGYAEDDIDDDADDWMKLTYPEDVDSVFQVVKDHIEMKTPEFQVSYRMFHKDGSLRWFLARGNVLPREAGGLSRVVGTSVDITNRVEMEVTIQESENRTRSIFRAAPIGIGVLSDRVLLEVNDRICEMVGRSQSEITGQSARIFYPTQEEFEWVGEEKYKQINEKGTGTVETRWQHKDGRIIDVLLSSTPLDVHDLSVGVTFTALDITERKRAQAALAEREATLSSIFRAVPVGIGLAKDRLFVEVNDRMCEMTGYPRQELLGQSAEMLYPSQAEIQRVNQEVGKQLREKGTAFVETVNRRKDGTLYNLLLNVAPMDPQDLMAGTTSIAMDITEIKRAQDALAQREATLSGIFRAAPVGISLTRGGEHVEVNEAMCELTGYSRAELLDHNPRRLYVTQAEYEYAADEIFSQIREKGRAVIETRTLRKDGTTYDTLLSLAPVDPTNPTAGLAAISIDISESKRTQAILAHREATLSSIFRAAPANISLSKAGKLIEVNEYMCETTGYSRDELVGASARMLFETQAEFEQTLTETARQIQEKGIAEVETRTRRKDGTTYDALVYFAPLDPDNPSSGQADVGIDITDRKQHERELETFIALATALREVDKRKEMITIILEEAIRLLSGNGALLGLHDETKNEIDFKLGVGNLEPIIGKRLKKGVGISGQVVESKQPYVSNDLVNDPKNHKFRNIPTAVAGAVMPLIAEGNIIGVLWVVKDHAFTENDVRILTIISEISANALHRVTLFENLENSNRELAMAYDTTLEGWAKALELRDKETEGHSRNVTDLTLKLAQKLDLNGDALLHIRRGALLHDIGKMGISDAILLKPGALNDVEWDIMRQHPVYAYELLAPIPYLEKALEIPYCHHEKWDGSGYPRGLKGEEIPLAARIFTLVDYWDALSSDRPYRNAWSKGKVIEYIKENKGVIFDPRIADVFLEMMAS